MATTTNDERVDRLRHRILIVSHWYWPEPNVKSNRLASELVQRGWKVAVVTAFPSYPYGKTYPGYRWRLFRRETVAGARLLRVPSFPYHGRSGLLRAISLWSFIVSASFFGLFQIRRPHLIWVYETPFHATIAARFLAAVFRCPYVTDVQDLWPETMSATGFSNSRRLARLILAITRSNHQKAARIVVPSAGFLKSLVSKGIDERKIIQIRNDTPSETTRDASLMPADECQPFRVIFAGNMGAAQGLDVVLHAARELRHEAVRFVMIGDGLELDHLTDLTRQLKLDNVDFLGRIPEADVPTALDGADALLVHLKDSPTFAATIPSKVGAYLAGGKPILCGVNGESAALVEAAQCGINFPAGDPQGLADAVLKLKALSPAQRSQMGQNGVTLYRREFAPHVVFEAYDRLLTQVAES